MSLVGSTLIAGTIGTIMLTTMVRGGSELGVTRMDLAFLLGTGFTENRRRAKAIGYACHFMLGVLFAFAYTALFVAIGRSSWWLGALAGALHALFVSTVVVNVLLPVVHPRMGTPDTAANEIALIEAPGFLMLNYGRNTFLLNLVAHIAYGAIIGAIVTI
jgi:uncharacterized membrane protein YagU involved in acid resistance